MACRDFDGDGRAEILISHSERAGYPIALYDNDDPRAEPWTEHVVYSGLTAVHTLQVGDIDQDGDDDIVAGENGGHSVEADTEDREVYLFVNQGDNLTWEPRLLKDDGLYNGLLHDLDGDGDLDLCGPAQHMGVPFQIWLNPGVGS